MLTLRHCHAIAAFISLSLLLFFSSQDHTSHYHPSLISRCRRVAMRRAPCVFPSSLLLLPSSQKTHRDGRKENREEGRRDRQKVYRGSDSQIWWEERKVREVAGRRKRMW